MHDHFCMLTESYSPVKVNRPRHPPCQGFTWLVHTLINLFMLAMCVSARKNVDHSNAHVLLPMGYSLQPVLMNIGIYIYLEGSRVGIARSSRLGRT
jgi:hypothetical protein